MEVVTFAPTLCRSLSEMNLSVYYQNVGGMNSKDFLVRIGSALRKEDCIAISESCLSPDRFSAEF